jgi:transcription antitermination factor NusG
MVDDAGGFRLTGEQRILRTASSTAQKTCGRLRWHVVSVVPDKQFVAENAISASGWRVYNPLHLQRYVRSSRIVCLFPGYVFVAWREGVDWSALCRMRWVWRILMSEPGRPSEVPAEVIGELMQRTSPRRIVDDPLWVPADFRRGQPVQVLEGPLAGLRGICQMSAGERVSVLFELFGRQMLTDFAPDEVMASIEA